MTSFTRRRFLRCAAGAGLLTAFDRFAPVYARTGRRLSGHAHDVDLEIAERALDIGGRATTGMLINGTYPGPLLRFREGEQVVIRVANRLKESTSIHWHGLIVPMPMDGVPGVSFPGIGPGETFTYRFPLKQNGTYWYHSHSGLQEQIGHAGPLIVDPVDPEPFGFDREYVVMLSDWTFMNPYKLLAKLKKESNYSNYQRRTVGDFFRDVSNVGFKAALADRAEWGKMRMDPTDIADVTGHYYTYLVNGLPPASNWTGIFKPGERVRVRFINAGAGTFFDVRIPGLPMRVVAADGQYVKPVTVDELRIAIAETFDVIVEPKEDRAYTLFAESMDRSGCARGTLAPRQGMSAAIPERRKRPLRTMADMGMGDMAGMKGMSGASPSQSAMPETSPVAANKHAEMAGMEASSPAPEDRSEMAAMAGMSPAPKKQEAMSDMSGMKGMSGTSSGTAHGTSDATIRSIPTIPAPGGTDAMLIRPDGTHGPDKHGPGNSVVAMMPKNRLHERGTGLEDAPWRVLVYSDLQGLKPGYDSRPPERVIELHATGNMERYMWSFDGKKFSEAPEPIPLYLGERVRLTLINDTMMEHPLHLHGMWMQLMSDHGAHNPLKHTIGLKPGEKLSVDITADAPGVWAFHCHILFHMEMGMLRAFSVAPRTAGG
jgi:FtsP/CotA-like multicopper oxidase with cupredoxin domain